MAYTDYLENKYNYHVEGMMKSGKKVDEAELRKYIEGYYAPVYPDHILLKPTSLTESLLKRLKYDARPSDVLWANYVHFMVSVLVTMPMARAMSFGSIIRSAIEALIEDEGFDHQDPYELWIDGGFLTKDLQPIDQTPYGDHTNQIIA